MRVVLRLYAKGELDKALKDINQSIKMCNGRVPSGFDIRSRIYWDLKRYDLAVKDISHAIKLNPKKAEFFNVRGFFMMNMGHLHKAREDFEMALHLSPQHVIAKQRLHQVLQLLKKEKDE